MIEELLNRINLYDQRIKEIVLRRMEELNAEEEWDDDYDEEYDGQELDFPEQADETGPSAETESGQQFSDFFWRYHDDLATSEEKVHFDANEEIVHGHGDYKHTDIIDAALHYTVSPDNPWYFEIDGVVFSRETGLLIRFPGGRGGVYTIPDDERITGIGESAFSGNRQLKQIVLTDRIRYIGDSAFAGTDFEEIVIPNSVEYLGAAAFAECRHLKRIVMDCDVRAVPYRCFRNDDALETVVFPKNVEFLARGAFTGCTGLKEMILPSSVLEIDGEAFFGCGSLRSLHIQGNEIIIGDMAFENCSSLRTINGEVITECRAHGFKNCKSLEEFTFGNKLRKLGKEIFTGASNLKVIRFSCDPSFTCVIDSLGNEFKYEVDTKAYLRTAKPFFCKPLFYECVRNVAKGENVPEEAYETLLQTLKRNRKKLYNLFAEDDVMLGFIMKTNILSCDDCIEMLKIPGIQESCADRIREYVSSSFSKTVIKNAFAKSEKKDQEKKEAEQAALRLKTEQEAERAALRIKTEQIIEAKDVSKDKYTIEQMDLSVRAYNCLKRKGINFLSDLMLLTAEDLIKFPNMGRRPAMKSQGGSG